MLVKLHTVLLKLNQHVCSPWILSEGMFTFNSHSCLSLYHHMGLVHMLILFREV